ncbi:transposase [Actinomadura welshii]|uniref:transposase n=1 Tax=Actinomadura welshii TaxID=3103817 RepID=UPI003B8A8F26
MGRIRGDRVVRLPKPSIKEYALACPQGGRPPKHGKEFRFANPETWPEAAITTVSDTTNYGKTEAQAWDRVHPRPGRACRSAHRARARCHRFGGGGPVGGGGAGGADTRSRWGTYRPPGRRTAASTTAIGMTSLLERRASVYAPTSGTVVPAQPDLEEDRRTKSRGLPVLDLAQLRLGEG